MCPKVVAAIIGNLINVHDLDVIEKGNHVIFFSPSRKIVLDYSLELFGSSFDLNAVVEKTTTTKNGWLTQGVVLRPMRADPELAIKIKRMVKV